MNESIQPLGNRVLLRVIDEDSVTPSGLLLPDTAKEKPQRGEVMAVGDEVEEEGKLSVGDRVIFAKYSGTEVQLRGVDHLLIDAVDLLAVLRPAVAS